MGSTRLVKSLLMFSMVILFIRSLGYTLYLWNVIQLLPELVGLYIEISRGSLKGTVLNLTSTLVGVQSAVKVGTILLKEKAIRNIIAQLQEMNADQREALDSETVEKASAKREAYSRLSAFFVQVVMVGVAHWVARPLFLAYTGEKVLIIEAWLPFSLDSWAAWWAVTIVQTIHVYTAMYGFFLFDSICYSMLASWLLEADLLSALLARVRFGGGSDGSGGPNIVFCIRQHQRLMKISRDMNALMKYILLMQYLFVTLVFCLSVFELSSVEGTTLVKMMNLIELIFNETYVVFLYSFLCQQVEDKNEDLLRAACDNDWYLGSIEDRHRLSVFIEASKKKIFIGMVVPSNLQTFITMLQTSFTYYNFLQAVAIE